MWKKNKELPLRRHSRRTQAQACLQQPQQTGKTHKESLKMPHTHVEQSKPKNCKNTSLSNI